MRRQNDSKNKSKIRKVSKPVAKLGKQKGYREERYLFHFDHIAHKPYEGLI